MNTAPPADGNSLSRDPTASALADAPLDLLVIGGGIVGAGVARDAALRGLRVGLIDKGDFASGTSSRSSRLLHGGLRYLAQGRLGLVRQAGRERLVLRRIAPHLARPLPFVFPAYHGSGWPLMAMRAGVKIYDLLCGNRGPERSHAMGIAQTVAGLPGINETRLSGSIRYYDAMTSDARLVIDTLRSAGAYGALLLNYACFAGACRDSATGLWTCSVRDLSADRDLPIQARAIVNATGPWASDLPGSGVSLRRTKGVHIVVDHERMPVSTAVVMGAGRRILFAIPWGRRTILGTTDTDYDGAPDAVSTSPEDVQQILEVVNHAFPSSGLGEKDVRASWAGVRPLIADGERGTPSDISRAHRIRWNAEGWLDVAGGKLTTYRLIGQESVDLIVDFLQKPFPRSTTAQLPLLASVDPLPVSGIEPPDLDQRLIEHYCRNEWAIHLDDVMTRRTGWRYYLDDPDAAAAQVCDWMGAELGWADETRIAELASYRGTL